ncbi:hypothetical protein FEM48_ZijujUnG0081800 [Ziziphus jujuba var. spinosa]|uniref:PGG domain-containing protein n=1 Tax=Ziziphus jujuba var. spinosa TaxID=714518 RepID=A0A978U8M8_ZIZJJ|nr:hypothetical protein FEM48_ZijujUnG0081800 [Ziziphus jujuba var. spinosa]
MDTSMPESESENLYRVTMQGKWEEVVKIYEKNPKAHKMRITHEGGTTLHLAVIECREETVLKLVQEISKIDKGALEIQNDIGYTPLHHAASAGSKTMCKYIVEAADPSLIGVRTNNTETALFIATVNGKKEAFFYLHSVCSATSVSSLPDHHLYSYTRRSKDGVNILHIALSKEHFGIVVKELKADLISNLHSEDRKNVDQNSKTSKLKNKQEGSLTSDVEIPISDEDTGSQLTIPSNEMQGIFPASYDKFVKVLITLGVEEKLPEKMAKADNIVLMAAKNGVVEIIEKFLEVFPAVIHDRSAEMKNILILAAENRHPNVYNLLIKKNILTETTFLRVDLNDNNVLHVAATYKKDRPWPIPGVALQMQWEIKWFEFVKASIPAGITFRRNQARETPEEVFSKTHEDLMKEGRDWLIKTSESCSVVAALIAGVAFATSAAIPGGTLDTSGKPIFETQRHSRSFPSHRSLALCFSVTALVMFLAIITSRFQEKDFDTNLPVKLLLGLSSLLFPLRPCWSVFAQAIFS